MLSFFKNRIIETVNSSLGYRLEVKEHNGKLILDAEHVNYSFGGLHKVFADAFKKADIRNRAIRNVLVLGFGAGSVANILLEEYKKDCYLTGVEIDEVVIALAQKYFNIDKYKNLKIIQEDAADFIYKDAQKYDLIVIDLYEDFHVPEFAESRDFLRQVEKHMNNSGIMFFNKMIYNIESQVSADKLKENLIDIFATVKEYRMKYAVSNSVFVCEKS